EDILRFAYPTYRNIPQYVTSTSSMAAASTATAPASDYLTAFPAAESFNSYVPQLQMPQLPKTSQYSPTSSSLALASTSPFPSAFPTYPVTGSSATTCLMDYLTAPNPTTALVRRINLSTINRGLHPFFDIRN